MITILLANVHICHNHPALLWCVIFHEYTSQEDIDQWGNCTVWCINKTNINFTFLFSMNNDTTVRSYYTNIVQHSQSLYNRSTNGILLLIPKTKLVQYGDHSFSKAAPLLWNQLPSHIQESQGLKHSFLTKSSSRDNIHLIGPWWDTILCISS